mmetsp:Transcript_8624/g.12533  ORF Transcript_8624/g.12533 Transcript_8624/m.12533 type:complete len:216 (-) Transcript_8624:1320-1967(-)
MKIAVLVLIFHDLQYIVCLLSTVRAPASRQGINDNVIAFSIKMDNCASIFFQVYHHMKRSGDFLHRCFVAACCICSYERGVGYCVGLRRQDSSLKALFHTPYNSLCIVERIWIVSICPRGQDDVEGNCIWHNSSVPIFVLSFHSEENILCLLGCSSFRTSGPSIDDAVEAKGIGLGVMVSPGKGCFHAMEDIGGSLCSVGSSTLCPHVNQHIVST